MAKARRNPEIVIIGPDEYRELLQRVEDLEDLRALDKMRRQRLQFTSLDDFLRKPRPSA